jgi:hypothetical protein
VPKPPRYYGSVGKKNQEKKSWQPMKQGSKPSPLRWGGGGRNGKVSKGELFFVCYVGERKLVN